MPLNEREAFKVGFLARCAEAGMGRDEILAAVKEAGDKVAGLLGGAGSAASSLAGSTLSLAVPAALLAPPLLGGAAGAGLARATDIDDTDVAEIKDHEIIDAYKAEAERQRRQKAVRDYARARAGTGRIFL